MSDFQYISRLLTAVAFTIFSMGSVIIRCLLDYLKNPLSNPFETKLRLLPPAVFSDPKYGVHQYVRLNSARIHYMESGDKTKPLMIFLHGFPEFWYSWRHQIVEFKKDYWCIAMDIRGFGDSEKTEGISHYKLDVLVEDLRSLILHLGRKNCILVSHDFGGVIACRFRDKHPDIVSAVVLLNSCSIEAWFNGIWTNWSQMMKSWYIFFFNLPWIPEKWMLMNDMAFFDKLMLGSHKHRISKDDIECYKYWTGKPSVQSAAINSYRANFMLTVEKKEVKSNIPMIAIYGAYDKVLENDILKNLKEEYTNLETEIIDNAGHCIQQEEPDIVNQLIKEFLINNNMS